MKCSILCLLLILPGTLFAQGHWSAFEEEHVEVDLRYWTPNSWEDPTIWSADEWSYVNTIFNFFYTSYRWGRPGVDVSSWYTSTPAGAGNLPVYGRQWVEEWDWYPIWFEVVEVQLNEYYTWNLDEDDWELSQNPHFCETLLHELGHAAGLEHDEWATAMYPYYWPEFFGYYVRWGLNDWDVTLLHEVYGGGNWNKPVASQIQLPIASLMASPNPFNPSTTLSFELPKDAYVQLKVFNSLGQQISLLLAEERLAGLHQFSWDGRNDQGQELASGTYFIRMELPHHGIVEKEMVTLLK